MVRKSARLSLGRPALTDIPRTSSRRNSVNKENLATKNSTKRLKQLQRTKDILVKTNPPIQKQTNPDKENDISHRKLTKELELDPLANITEEGSTWIDTEVKLVYDTSVMSKVLPLIDKIYYSKRYPGVEAGEKFEYRHVNVNDLFEYIPEEMRYRCLTEEEWRSLGIKMSPGWEHYIVHRPEPWMFMFKRKVGNGLSIR